MTLINPDHPVMHEHPPYLPYVIPVERVVLIQKQLANGATVSRGDIQALVSEVLRLRGKESGRV